MKLEMGESLVRTWMRHHRGCQLAELNWKPSMNWGNTGTPEHQEWYDSDQINFKRTESSKLSQLLKQAEIDVLGVRFEDGKAQEIIAADIAVHTGGLSYKDKENTKLAILTKLLRMAIILDLHFPNIRANLLFISPKITPATLTCILGEDYSRFVDFFKIRRKKFTFDIIYNETFNSEILQNVLSLRKDVADTSELFLRSAQIMALFDK